VEHEAGKMGPGWIGSRICGTCKGNVGQVSRIGGTCRRKGGSESRIIGAEIG
jgi:hypothetical protein